MLKLPRKSPPRVRGWGYAVGGLLFVCFLLLIPIVWAYSQWTRLEAATPIDTGESFGFGFLLFGLGVVEFVLIATAVVIMLWVGFCRLTGIGYPTAPQADELEPS